MQDVNSQKLQQSQVAASASSRGKRYSTQRQRSLPESGISFSPPPAAFQQPPQTHYYQPQSKYFLWFPTGFHSSLFEKLYLIIDKILPLTTSTCRSLIQSALLIILKSHTLLSQRKTNWKPVVYSKQTYI